MTPRAILLAATVALAPLAALAEGRTHHLAVHVDDGDPQKLNLALNNVQNVRAHYAAQGDAVTIEVVAYGPGLQMFIDGESPVADRIEAMALEGGDVTFSACGNTIASIEKNTGQKVNIMDEVRVVPSGVVRLIELQEDGYAYVRP
jgi:intracellular sulfur oxidation DsrE/DsrF family protein